MSKKLNITSITNELEESAFFPSNKPQPLSPTPITDTTTLEESKRLKIVRPTIEPKQQIPERPNERTPQRHISKRIITRNSFEIYEDQMDSLRRISFNEKMDGKPGSMSRMVRDAIDKYLQDQPLDD